MNPVPPAFEKYNQHYVPQFWQRGFSNVQGHVWARYRKEVDPIAASRPKLAGQPRQISTRDTMTGLYTYTVFDQNWRPSDEVEAELSKAEGHIANVIDEIVNPAAVLTDRLRSDLCWAIGLSASRMPHVMNRGHRRIKELVIAIAQIHAYTDPNDFTNMLREKFACTILQEEYDHFSALSQEELNAQVQSFEALSPQSPILPEQVALLGTDLIADMIKQMDLSLLDAGAIGFILGDTPQPDSALKSGFSIPLTKSVALDAKPTTGKPTSLVRRNATASEVRDTNQWQYDNSLNIVIGPDPNQLAALT